MDQPPRHPQKVAVVEAPQPEILAATRSVSGWQTAIGIMWTMATRTGHSHHPG